MKLSYKNKGNSIILQSQPTPGQTGGQSSQGSRSTIQKNYAQTDIIQTRGSDSRRQVTISKEDKHSFVQSHPNYQLFEEQNSILSDEPLVCDFEKDDDNPNPQNQISIQNQIQENHQQKVIMKSPQEQYSHNNDDINQIPLFLKELHNIMSEIQHQEAFPNLKLQNFKSAIEFKQTTAQQVQIQDEYQNKAHILIQQLNSYNYQDQENFQTMLSEIQAQHKHIIDFMTEKCQGIDFINENYHEQINQANKQIIKSTELIKQFQQDQEQYQGEQITKFRLSQLSQLGDSVDTIGRELQILIFEQIKNSTFNTHENLNYIGYFQKLQQNQHLTISEFHQKFQENQKLDIIIQNLIDNQPQIPQIYLYLQDYCQLYIEILNDRIQVLQQHNSTLKNIISLIESDTIIIHDVFNFSKQYQAVIKTQIEETHLQLLQISLPFLNNQEKNQVILDKQSDINEQYFHQLKQNEINLQTFENQNKTHQYQFKRLYNLVQSEIIKLLNLNKNHLSIIAANTALIKTYKQQEEKEKKLHKLENNQTNIGIIYQKGETDIKSQYQAYQLLIRKLMDLKQSLNFTQFKETQKMYPQQIHLYILTEIDRKIEEVQHILYDLDKSLEQNVYYINSDVSQQLEQMEKLSKKAEADSKNTKLTMFYKENIIETYNKIKSCINYYNFIKTQFSKHIILREQYEKFKLYSDKLSLCESDYLFMIQVADILPDILLEELSKSFSIFDLKDPESHLHHELSLQQLKEKLKLTQRIQIQFPQNILILQFISAVIPFIDKILGTFKFLQGQDNSNIHIFHDSITILQNFQSEMNQMIVNLTNFSEDQKLLFGSASYQFMSQIYTQMIQQFKSEFENNYDKLISSSTLLIQNSLNFFKQITTSGDKSEYLPNFIQQINLKLKFHKNRPNPGFSIIKKLNDILQDYNESDISFDNKLEQSSLNISNLTHALNTSTKWEGQGDSLIHNKILKHKQMEFFNINCEDNIFLDQFNFKDQYYQIIKLSEVNYKSLHSKVSDQDISNCLQFILKRFQFFDQLSQIYKCFYIDIVNNLIYDHRIMQQEKIEETHYYCEKLDSLMAEFTVQNLTVQKSIQQEFQNLNKLLKTNFNKQQQQTFKDFADSYSQIFIRTKNEYEKLNQCLEVYLPYSKQLNYIIGTFQKYDFKIEINKKDFVECFQKYLNYDKQFNKEQNSQLQTNFAYLQFYFLKSKFDKSYSNFQDNYFKLFYHQITNESIHEKYHEVLEKILSKKIQSNNSFIMLDDIYDIINSIKKISFQDFTSQEDILNFQICIKNIIADLQILVENDKVYQDFKQQYSVLSNNNNTSEKNNNNNVNEISYTNILSEFRNIENFTLSKQWLSFAFGLQNIFTNFQLNIENRDEQVKQQNRISFKLQQLEKINQNDEQTKIYKHIASTLNQQITIIKEKESQHKHKVSNTISSQQSDFNINNNFKSQLSFVSNQSEFNNKASFKYKKFEVEEHNQESEDDQQYNNQVSFKSTISNQNYTQDKSLTNYVNFFDDHNKISENLKDYVIGAQEQLLSQNSNKQQNQRPLFENINLNTEQSQETEQKLNKKQQIQNKKSDQKIQEQEDKPKTTKFKNIFM